MQEAKGKKIQDREDLIGSIPDQMPVLVDRGFQGVQKQYVNIRLPQKKPLARRVNSRTKIRKSRTS